MSDTTALCCYGSGFDTQHRICVLHLREAFESATQSGDLELAAIIRLKYEGKLTTR